MMGKNIGLKAFIKKILTSVHCCLHRQVLAANCMPDFLKESLDIVLKVMNSVKSSATSCRLFAKPCGENEVKHDKLLFFFFYSVGCQKEIHFPVFLNEERN